MNFYDKITKKREERGISLRQLCNQIRENYDTVKSQFRNNNLRTDTFIKICTILDINMEEFKNEYDELKKLSKYFSESESVLHASFLSDITDIDLITLGEVFDRWGEQYANEIFEFLRSYSSVHFMMLDCTPNFKMPNGSIFNEMSIQHNLLRMHKILVEIPDFIEVKKYFEIRYKVLCDTLIAKYGKGVEDFLLVTKFDFLKDALKLEMEHCMYNYLLNFARFDMHKEGSVYFKCFLKVMALHKQQQLNGAIDIALLQDIEKFIYSNKCNNNISEEAFDFVVKEFNELKVNTLLERN